MSKSTSKEKEDMQSPVIGVSLVNPYTSPSSYSNHF
ncbi:hypothetical protein FHU15_005333 [Clostridium beijerinckii]|nr:hypothetical protein [Clostridium beijerinckii]